MAALNAIRFGRCPPEVRAVLAPCERRELLDTALGIVATKLCTHKAECQAINDAQLAKLPGSQMTFTARDQSLDESALGLLRSACVAPPLAPVSPAAVAATPPTAE